MSDIFDQAAQTSGGDIFDQAAASTEAAAQENAHQTRMSALAGLTGMPTINMTPEDRQAFAQARRPQQCLSRLWRGVTAAGAAGMLPPAARALRPIAARYGIRALEGAGLGLGYDLYKELKKVFAAE